MRRSCVVPSQSGEESSRCQALDDVAEVLKGLERRVAPVLGDEQVADDDVLGRINSAQVVAVLGEDRHARIRKEPLNERDEAGR